MVCCRGVTNGRTSGARRLHLTSVFGRRSDAEGVKRRHVAVTKTIDELFQLPLPEFTAARNALASQLKKSGSAELATRVKGLSKPSVSAWTVNQLFWRHRKAFDRLMKSGEAFRHAQAAQLAGKSADLRAALEARREVLAELSRLAASILGGAGHAPSPETMRRVTTTLEALSTYSGAPGSPAPGQLVDDVDPPGFETLAALVPSVGGRAGGTGAGAVLKFDPGKKKVARKGSRDPRQQEADRKTQLAAARAAVQDAERTLREAQKAAAKAEAALKAAAARLKTAEREREELDAAVERAAAVLTEARQDARRVTGEAEDAAQAVTDAERALETARAKLDDL